MISWHEFWRKWMEAGADRDIAALAADAWEHEAREIEQEHWNKLNDWVKRRATQTTKPTEVGLEVPDGQA